MEPLGSDDPRQVGDYRLLRRLGAGGMGRVYLGRTAGGRTVAVKVVRSELADDPQFRARFRQEVASARLVGGHWTAPVLDADTESDHPWVATGYVAGPALGAAVQRFGALPVRAVRTLGSGLAEALTAVHGLGLVHRDVKPSNVLLTLDGPRLIDFGISRALDSAGTLTQSGYVVGSPGYMSPEQAQGGAAGPASDVFSLGAVLAYASTGVPPFGEDVSAAVLLYRVLHEEPDLAALPGPLREVVTACLAKAPADRPTLRELGRRLAEESGATVQLVRGGWLPPAVAEAVARSAVELLELESEPADTAPGVRPVRGPGWRRWWPAVAAVAALAVTGSLLAWRPWAPVTPHPGVTGSDTPSASPSAGASASPSADPSGSAPGDGPRTVPAAPPDPGPSIPSAVPAAFLGTWSGPVTTSDLGGLGAEVETVTVRPAAIGAENTTSHNASNPGGILTIGCEGAWTLTSATATKLVFTARLVGESSSGVCSRGSTKEQLELAADGSLHYTSLDAPAGNPTGELRRVR